LRWQRQEFFGHSQTLKREDGWIPFRLKIREHRPILDVSGGGLTAVRIGGFNYDWLTHLEHFQVKTTHSDPCPLIQLHSFLRGTQAITSGFSSALRCTRERSRVGGLSAQFISSRTNPTVYFASGLGKALGGTRTLGSGASASLRSPNQFFSLIRTRARDKQLIERDQSKHSSEDHHQPIMQSGHFSLALYPEAELAVSAICLLLGILLVFLGLGCFQFWLLYALQIGSFRQAFLSICCGSLLLFASFWVVHVGNNFSESTRYTIGQFSRYEQKEYARTHELFDCLCAALRPSGAWANDLRSGGQLSSIGGRL